MPLSWPGQIPTVLDCVLKRAPASILDVGVGFGAYGALLRQYLPDALLVGVEPFVAYRGKGRGHNRWWAYDAVKTKPWPAAYLQLAVEGRALFDVALAVDVLEHVPYDEAPAFIEALLTVARAVVIATPHDPDQWPQTDQPNPLEAHVSRWPLAAFRPYPVVEAHHLQESIVVVLESEEACPASSSSPERQTVAFSLTSEATKSVTLAPSSTTRQR